MINNVIQIINNKRDKELESIQVQIDEFQDKIDDLEAVNTSLDTPDITVAIIAGENPEEILANHKIIQDNEVIIGLYGDVINAFVSERIGATAPHRNLVSSLNTGYSALLNHKANMLETHAKNEPITPLTKSHYISQLNATKSLLANSGIDFNGADDELFSSLDKLEQPSHLMQLVG